MFKDENRHYSLRKLSVGLASVLIGISFVSGNGHTVKADTVKDGSNGAQTVVQTTADDSNTVVKDRDAAIEANTKDDANAATKANAESTPKEQSQTPEAVKKNSDTITQDIRQKAVKASEATINVQNNTVKDNSDETTLNVKGSKAATESMPKEGKTEVKENHGWTDPVKNKLQMSTVRSTTSKRLNVKLLAVSKVVSQANDTNGGFDSSWGKLDVNDWKGNVQGDYYQLTDYTGDVNHIIVPNEADFAKAGISTSGKQVGVTSDLMHTIFRDKTTAQDATVAFSKTDNKQVKAIGDYWSNTWGHAGDYVNGSQTWSKGKLTKFDGSNLDVANITNMSYMFHDNQISDLRPLANWKVEKVTDMGDMFNGNQISDLRPLADWKVDKVANMSYMFHDNQISNLSPLANWKVNNVARMGGMFYDNRISDLNPLSNWNVNNVTDMSYMFHNNQISDLRPLANWNVNNVTDMNNMFYYNHISDLSPLANWKVNNVTNMSWMFFYNHIIDLNPLSNWKVNNVTDMSYMFHNNQISDLRPLANWNVNNVTDMNNMFFYNHISNLSSLSNWKVNNVTNMSNMFADNQISDLSPLSNWKVNNVTNMSNMFAGNQISNLSPLSNWNVNNVTNMSGMFDGNQISNLSPLSNWNVNNVTNMSNMFYDNQISDLNPLANWKVDKVTNMSSMFDHNVTTQTKTIQAKRVINFIYPDGYTGKKQDPVTQTIDVPQKVDVRLITKDSKPSNNILDWTTKTENPEDPDPVYFQDYTVPEIKGLLEPDQTVISKQRANANKPINVTVTYKLVDSNTNDAFALDSKNGLHEHINVNDNGGYDVDYWGKINVNDWNYTVNNDRIEIIGLKYGVSTGANDAVIVPNLDDFKLAGKDGGTKSVYISKKALGEINVLGNSTAHKYYGLSKTNGGKFVTDSDLNNAFNNSNLTHADLNSLDTAKVTDMSDVFNYASSLKSLDVSKWDTGKVTDMSGMFSGTSDLTNLDVSKWNTGKVTNMRSMFSGASSLTSLDVSKWNTSNVTDMGYMFSGASSLTSLDVSKWDTSKVTDMGYMFSGASSLTSLDVSKWDTSNVTNMSWMFKGANSLNSLNVLKWDTSNVTNMSWMFEGARSLTSLDVSKWDTGNVTDMSWMFYGASSLALLVNNGKFADYLVNHDSFAKSSVDSGAKSVTTNNVKLLQLLTNDIQHNSATRTIVFTFPTGYNPDLTKYHLTKTGNTYQIKQSADYDTSYAQGTVLINATDDITKHHIDTTKPYKLSDTWQPNYDKLVLAHKNADGTVSFDKVQLPKVPGYKAKVTRNNGLLMVSYLVFAPEKPATNNNLNELQFSNKLATNSTIQFNSAVKSDIVVKSDMYQVVNNDHNWQLPVIKSYDLKLVANNNQIIFAYTKDKQYNYRFDLIVKDGQYRLTTFDKQNKLLKTYSIESYKKLAEIIHSLVSMNIA